MRTSPRGSRFRPLILLALLILTVIYLTTGSRSTQTSEFYTRTVAAMDARQKSLRENIGGVMTQAEHKAAKAQQAAEAKVRNHDGEITLPSVKDHEGGKGERVSKDKADADVVGQKPIVDAKEAAKEAKAKAKAVADEVVGKAKSVAGAVSSSNKDPKTGGAKDYSGKGGHRDDTGTVKDGAKQYSGKGGHKEEVGAKPGDAKYHAGSAIADTDDTDSVHGPKDADKSGKKVQGKAGSDDGVAKVGNTGKAVKDEAKKAVQSGAAAVKAASGKKTDDETEALLNDILKKSPLIIFSKSYCPYSKMAKRILLEEYKIVPAPYVEELDLHEQGEKLQDALLKTTGRRTVPNVLINGVSIGGGDDVSELHEAGKLADKILELGGKRFVEVSKAAAAAAAAASVAEKGAKNKGAEKAL